MIFGFIIGIVIAYLLTLIQVDQNIMSGVRDVLKVDIGTSGYYLMMGILGGISLDIIGGIFYGIIVAFLFTFVNLDHIIIQGVKEWFKYDMGMGTYYLLFAVIGAAMSFLTTVRMFFRPIYSMGRRKG